MSLKSKVRSLERQVRMRKHKPVFLIRTPEDYREYTEYIQKNPDSNIDGIISKYVWVHLMDYDEADLKNTCFDKINF